MSHATRQSIAPEDRLEALRPGRVDDCRRVAPVVRLELRAQFLLRLLQCDETKNAILRNTSSSFQSVIQAFDSLHHSNRANHSNLIRRTCRSESFWDENESQ